MVLIDIISLAVQYIIALVVSLYGFSFSSYGTMATKAAVIVGCRTEVWLAEAVGLVCWLIVERLRLAWKHTDAFGVLFWSVHVEMKEEVFGRRHILHLMLVWHLSDFRYPNYFQISEVVWPFFGWISLSLPISSHSVTLVRLLTFLCRLDTIILSCCLWEGPETCIHHVHLFLCCVIGCWCSVL